VVGVEKNGVNTATLRLRYSFTLQFVKKTTCFDKVDDDAPHSN